MTRYAKRKLKYSLNENFNLLPYVEWDRFVTLSGMSGMRVTLSYLANHYTTATVIIEKYKIYSVHYQNTFVAE